MSERSEESEATIHAVFVRHGEKDTDGNLTVEGRAQAKNAGASLKAKTAIKSFIPSGVKRVEQTVELLTESAPHVEKLRTRVRNGLKHVTSKEFLATYREKEKIDSTLATDYYLGFGENRPDPETLAPHEIAQYVAHLLLKYAHALDRMDEGSDVDLVHGVQQGIPEALLKEVLVREDGSRGFKSLNEIGGALGFAEMMEFILRKEDSGYDLSLLFRGRKFDIDRARLEALAEEYRENKRRLRTSEGQ